MLAIEIPDEFITFIETLFPVKFIFDIITLLELFIIIPVSKWPIWPSPCSVMFELSDIKIPVYGFKYPEPKREEELKSRLMLLLLIIIPFT